MKTTREYIAVLLTGLSVVLLFSPIASAALCHMGNTGVRLGGAKLKYDAVKHEFIRNRRANKFLTREYRKGYELAYTG